MHPSPRKGKLGRETGGGGKEAAHHFFHTPVSQSASFPVILSCHCRHFTFSILFASVVQQPLLARMNTATMLQSNTAKRAAQCLPRARRFSSTPAATAVSPYRHHAQSQTQTTSRRNVSDTAPRSAQAAAATRRAVPSPAFNRIDEAKLRDVQPLQPFRQPEMDHSFVGMSGGQIFHEMMLRQGVKHVCRCNGTKSLVP